MNQTIEGKIFTIPLSVTLVVSAGARSRNHLFNEVLTRFANGDYGRPEIAQAAIHSIAYCHYNNRAIIGIYDTYGTPSIVVTAEITRTTSDGQIQIVGEIEISTHEEIEAKPVELGPFVRTQVAA